MIEYREAKLIKAAKRFLNKTDGHIISGVLFSSFKNTTIVLTDKRLFFYINFKEKYSVGPYETFMECLSDLSKEHK